MCHHQNLYAHKITCPFQYLVISFSFIVVLSSYLPWGNNILPLLEGKCHRKWRVINTDFVLCIPVPFMVKFSRDVQSCFATHAIMVIWFHLLNILSKSIGLGKEVVLLLFSLGHHAWLFCSRTLVVRYQESVGRFLEEQSMFPLRL